MTCKHLPDIDEEAAAAIDKLLINAFIALEKLALHMAGDKGGDYVIKQAIIYSLSGFILSECQNKNRSIKDALDDALDIVPSHVIPSVLGALPEDHPALTKGLHEMLQEIMDVLNESNEDTVKH